MSDRPSDHFGFTKLVVNDLERCSAFYQEVFGLSELNRVDADVADRKISEIMFNPTGKGAATFVLFKFLDSEAPAGVEVIAGFITTDLEALVARAVEAGGTIAQPIRSMPEHGVNVAFVADVEGHLLEVVEQL